MLYSTSAATSNSNHLIAYDIGSPKAEQKKWLRSSIADIAHYLHVPVTTQLQYDNEVFQHIHYRTGQRIFNMGSSFHSIYLINSGFTKSVIRNESGIEQVVNFQMKGDILGVDGIHSSTHNSEAIALTDCDLIVLPLHKLAELGKTYQSFEKAIFNIISTELVHQQNRLCILSARNSEGKVADFLLNLAGRYFQLGYSRSSFTLRMTRNDIGSYLGLTLETVSRTLSVLNDSGLIEVKHRRITIPDAQELRNLTGCKKARCAAE
jgi:CRP/FNR family transcriptional regulator